MVPAWVLLANRDKGVASPAMGTTTAPRARNPRALGSAVVVVAGAGVYALLVGGDNVRFAATPLILGIIAVVAGLVGTRHRVIATGLVLGCWGTAVLLVDHGVVPTERTTPAYMLGVAVGLLVAAGVAPRADRAAWLTSASIAAFTGPLSLYAAYDVTSLGRWPLWSAVLLVWGAWEAFWAWRARDVTPARTIRPVEA